MHLYVHVFIREIRIVPALHALEVEPWILLPSVSFRASESWIALDRPAYMDEQNWMDWLE